MGLFYPQKERFEQLMKRLDGGKVLPLEEAALTLGVKEKRVQATVSAMARQKLFGEDCPYVDAALQLLVLDSRYSAHAELMSALALLRRECGEALVQLRRAAPVPGDKSRAVGSFLKQVVDASLSGKDAGKIFRTQTGALVRDLLSPTVTSVPEAITRCEQALLSLDTLCSQTQGLARLHPLSAGARELSATVHAMRRAVTEVKNGAQAGHAPRLPQELTQTLYRQSQRFCQGAACPTEPGDTVLSDLRAQREALQQQALLLHNEQAREALAILRTLLLDLESELSYLDASARLTAARPLRVCYLPMLRELVEKQLRYEALMQPDEAAQRAMAESLTVLSRDLPEAFLRLRKSLRESSALDLEAQSEALRRKLQLDGLLDAAL